MAHNIKRPHLRILPRNQPCFALSRSFGRLATPKANQLALPFRSPTPTCIHPSVGPHARMERPTMLGLARRCEAGSTSRLQYTLFEYRYQHSALNLDALLCFSVPHPHTALPALPALPALKARAGRAGRAGGAGGCRREGGPHTPYTLSALAPLRGSPLAYILFFL